MTRSISIVVPKMNDAQHFNRMTNFTVSGHLFSLGVFFFLFVVQDHFIHMEISSLNDKGLQNIGIR